MSGDDSLSVERPIGPLAAGPAYGSDVIAATLRALDIPFIALNPGASFRGLEDSLVNYLGNVRPSLLLCLHEEAAVAIAHGYAKVTGRAMAAAVHSNVGLFHATMAIFNAWCDRMPVLVLGATGPIDAAKRRPWIDWIHTARDQGSVVRSYVKWDDQPASPAAAREAVLRAAQLAQTPPMAPVYVNFDAELQEAALAEPLPEIDHARFTRGPVSGAPAGTAARLIELLERARHPILLVGRVSRDQAAWDARVAVAERFGAQVVTDLKVGAGFPTDHPLHTGAPGIYAAPEALAALRRSDVILSLDWVDLAGTLAAAYGPADPAATIVHASLDHALHNGWSMDHQGLPPVDLALAIDPDRLVLELCAALGPAAGRSEHARVPASAAGLADEVLSVDRLAHELRQVVGDRAVSLLHLPLGWNGASWPFRHPLDFLGSDGGGGIGGGPGISVGAALALRGTRRLPVGILGDGDYVMGVTALWTAVHYRIPLLIVVANNRSYFNDEVHQERVARSRDRRVENRWIGQRMTDPEIDLAQLARAQGAEGVGPIRSVAALGPALVAAIAAVDAGAVAVVDVHVVPGYTPSMTAALTRGTP